MAVMLLISLTISTFWNSVERWYIVNDVETWLKRVNMIVFS